MTFLYKSLKITFLLLFLFTKNSYASTKRAEQASSNRSEAESCKSETKEESPDHVQLLSKALKILEAYNKNPNPDFILKTHNLLKSLHRSEIPEIKKFFFVDEEFAYINIFGLQIVDHEFQKEQGKLWIPAEIFYYNYKDLVEQLTKPEKLESSAPFLYVILNRYDPDFLDPHLAPLVIIHHEDYIDIFFFDSRGIEKDLYPKEEIKRLLLDTDIVKPLNFYFSSIPRQKDYFSCPVFSHIDIRNLVELNFVHSEKTQGILKRESELMEEIKPNALFYTLKVLPPLLMYKCQSCTEIEKADSIASHLDFENIRVRRRSFTSESGSEEIEEIEITREYRDYSPRLLAAHGFPANEGKLVNFYAQKKWLKFVKIILTHIVTNKT